MSYTIEINEAQRQLLMKALLNTKVDELRRVLGTGCGAYDTEAEEFVALVQMFGTLKDVESESPGVIHGFCL